MNSSSVFFAKNDIRFRKILLFVLPTYLTTLFNTLYTIVDGMFVSKYVGTNALAAINIVYPIVNVLTGIALMFATGGSSLAAISAGAKNNEQANQEFTLSIIFSLAIGTTVSLAIAFNLSRVLTFLGATPLILDDCKTYALIWLIGVPAVIGKELLTYFIRMSGSPGYSFFLSISGGISNILLDYIFVAQMKMGVLGAGLATLFGLFLSVIFGILYFPCRNTSLIPTFKHLKFKTGLRCAVNGFSEFIDQIAIAITTVIFNRAALSFAGEDGIASVSIIMYLQFLFIGIYFGYASGVSPLLSYAYGNKSDHICKKLENYARCFFIVAPLILYIVAYCTSPLTVSCFTEPETTVFSLALNGMRLYGIGYLFSGFNIYATIRLTSYGKGHYSAIITLLRSFILLLLFLYFLPNYLQLNGVWLAMPAAEFLTLFVTLYINHKFKHIL